MAKKIYSSAQIKQAAQYYFLNGSIKKTAKETGIPRTTIQTWKDEGNIHWEGELTRIEMQENREMETHFTKLIQFSIKEMEDRLKNGDQFYDPKKGEFYRKKVGARDLAIIGGTLFDKRALIQVDSNLEKRSPEETDEYLEKVHQKLFKSMQEQEAREAEHERLAFAKKSAKVINQGIH